MSLGDYKIKPITIKKVILTILLNLLFSLLYCYKG